MTQIQTLMAQLTEAGYEPRRKELLAVVGALTAPKGMGAPALLLEGAPGCGKTALAECVAKVLKCEFVYALMHPWTDTDELFMGVDVAAAVAGDSASVRQDGVLARAAKLSLNTMMVVVCLDEVDKTSERAENLLLDFLQTGRVPVKPGVQIQGNLGHMVVFLTSNGMRELGDALLRRVRRVRMDPLPVASVERLAAARTGVPIGVAKLVARAMREIAQHEGNNAISLQEIVRGLAEIWKVAQSHDDVREILSGWGARTPKGAQAAAQSHLSSAIWAEVINARR